MKKQEQSGPELTQEDFDRRAALTVEIQKEIDITMYTVDRASKLIAAIGQRLAYLRKEAQTGHDALSALAGEIAPMAPTTASLALIVCDHLSGVATQLDILTTAIRMVLGSGYLEVLSEQEAKL